MRQPRIIMRNQTAVYHCISRCAGNQFLLQDPDKEQLRCMLWQQAEFCGIQVITHGILDNHFHIEVRVAPVGELSDAQLLGRAERFYPPEAPLLRLMHQELARDGVLSKRLRQQLLRRMGDLSCFMKELKQRFSRWYNGCHERFGTLWAQRFTSVLVQDDPEVVRTIALYIDLNAVRANVVTDPAEYRFCGYAEAVGGNPLAQAGLLSALGQASWEKGGPEYRQMLFVTAGSAGAAGKALLKREAILKVLAEKGKISYQEALRLRVRYFSAGLVLGFQDYVEARFQQFRKQFGKTRLTGARKLRGLPFDKLRTLRDLRIQPVS
jgi:putative transposase